MNRRRAVEGQGGKCVQHRYSGGGNAEKHLQLEKKGRWNRNTVRRFQTKIEGKPAE